MDSVAAGPGSREDQGTRSRGYTDQNHLRRARRPVGGGPSGSTGRPPRLLAAVDHAPDFGPRTPPPAVASPLLQNQNQAEIYKDEDFVRVFEGDPARTVGPPDMRDDASAPVPAPKSPTTLAEAIHEDMVAKGFTRSTCCRHRRRTRARLLEKARRVRDRANKAGDRAEEATCNVPRSPRRPTLPRMRRRLPPTRRRSPPSP